MYACPRCAIPWPICLHQAYALRSAAELWQACLKASALTHGLKIKWNHRPINTTSGRLSSICSIQGRQGALHLALPGINVGAGKQPRPALHSKHICKASTHTPGSLPLVEAQWVRS